MGGYGLGDRMSGPITPPLTVTEVDGAPSGRPITTIKVSNGDLTISGNVATIDTSGSGGTPATPANAIQFNSDPAGTFTGSSQLVYETGSSLGRIEMKTGNSTTLAEIRAVDGFGLKLASSDVAASAVRSYIDLYGENDSPTGIAIISKETGGTIWLKTTGVGVTDIGNETTDQGTTLQVTGNGTGDATINLNNPTKAVSLICDTNKKLKIQGGTDTFIFDASSASGGITWPDGTTQTTAASGGGASELSDLTDVLIDATNFTDGFLIQPNSNGAAPTTGTLSSASNNVGIGSDCLLQLTTGDHNICLGSEAGRGFTGATKNISIGGGSNWSGGNQSNNVAVGYSAMSGPGSGADNNVGIGFGSLAAVTGDENTAVGSGAGNNILGGEKNLCLGVNSGNITTGSNNIIIGGADADSATASDQLIISSGDGTPIWVKGDSAGSCYQGDNASTWSTTSDERLKTNIIDSPKGLEEIKLLKVRNFNYIERATPITEEIENEDGEIEERIIGYDGENKYNLDPEPLRTGFIAQELEVILPEAVKENLHGHKTVDIDPVIYSLINAVQELSAKVETLEGMIE